MDITEHNIATPLGVMRLWASASGLLRADFADSDTNQILHWARRMFGEYRLLADANNAVIIQAQAQLEAYFAGLCDGFDLALDLRGSSFQKSVWHALCYIPAGTTWSYQALATHIGHPKAVRAVGSANGANPISVIVPCHRLIGSDGKLHGYGGGLARKQALLDLEHASFVRRSIMTNYARPSDEELRNKLTPEQYKVTQNEGTEPPFRNEYWDNKQAGIYVDVVSGEPLFSSLDKYDSGTGWPSFTQPLEPENIVTHTDRKLWTERTEVRSKHGESHLGHVFDDGPQPTGQRYCMNSSSLRFIPIEKLEEEGYGQYLALFNPQKV